MKSLTAEQVAKIAEFYPYHTNVWITKQLGISVRSIWKYAKKLHLEKDQECYKAIRDKISATSIRLVYTPEYRESFERRVQTRKAIEESERKRLRWGLPQKTKYKVSLLSKTESSLKRSMRYKLRKKGYIEVERNVFEITESTNRNPRSEAIGEKKYNLKFIIK